MSNLTSVMRLAENASSPIILVGSRVVQLAGASTLGTLVPVSGLSGGVESTPRANDLIFVHYAYGDGTDRGGYITGGSNPVTIADRFVDDTYDLNFTVGYTFYDGSDIYMKTDGTGSGTNSPMCLGIMVFRNVDESNPMDVTPVIRTQASNPNPDPNAITPITSGAVIVVGGYNASNRSNETFTSSDLDNFITIGSSGSGWPPSLGLGTKAWSGSGSFDPAAFTWSGSTTSSYVPNGAVTAALRPKHPS